MIKNAPPFSTSRFVEAHGTVCVRRPVRPDVDPVLSSFLKIEEHMASEDAEERWAPEGKKYGLYRHVIDCNLVTQDYEHSDTDRSEEMDLSNVKK